MKSVARSWFMVALCAALAIRFAIAAWAPLTGDEAYYVLWGKHFDLGYYDQPPMIGWIEHVLLWFSSGKVWLRLPAILLPVLIAPLMVRLLKRKNPEKAYWAGTLYLLAPMHLLPVFIATDIPLIFFSFLSMYFLFLGLQEDRKLYSLVAGGFFGLAFLSKYFVLFLAIAAFFYVLSKPGRKKGFGHLLLLFFGALPFGLIHLGWNATHCWANVVFNVSGRNTGEVWDLRKFWTFWLYQVYLITPVLLYFWVRAGRTGIARIRESGARFFVWVYCVPILAFAATALKFSQGLHWTLSYYPFLFLATGVALSEPQLRKALAWMVGITGLHLLALLIFALIPLSHWKSHPSYRFAVMFFRPDRIVEKVRELSRRPNTVVVSDGYTMAALVNGVSDYYLPLIDEDTKFGHEDDFISDFRMFNGMDVAIVSNRDRGAGDFQAYFDEVHREEFDIEGGRYFLFLGKNFSYPRYHDKVLVRVRDEFYKIPAFFPKAGCPFLEKYF